MPDISTAAGLPLTLAVLFSLVGARKCMVAAIATALAMVLT